MRGHVCAMKAAIPHACALVVLLPHKFSVSRWPLPLAAKKAVPDQTPCQKRGCHVGGLLVHDVLPWTAGDHTEREEVDLPVGLVEVIVAFGGDQFGRHLVIRFAVPSDQYRVSTYKKRCDALQLVAHRDCVGGVLVEVDEGAVICSGIGAGGKEFVDIRRNAPFGQWN